MWRLSYAGTTQLDLSFMPPGARIDLARSWLDGTHASFGLTGALFEVGELAAAERATPAGLERARQAGAQYDQADFLYLLAHLHLAGGTLPRHGSNCGRPPSSPHGSAFRIALIDGLDMGGSLCAAGRRWDDAVTIWAAPRCLPAHLTG